MLRGGYSVLKLKRTQEDMGRIRRKEVDMQNKIKREQHRGKVPDEWFDLPASRTEAEKLDGSKYFDGNFCERGHLSLRYPKGQCCECHAELDKNIRQTLIP